MEVILGQAVSLFLEKGFHGTSIDDIMKASNLTKGAFYWHFSSKEDLLRNIVEEFDKRFLDGLIESVSKVKGNALKKLEKLFRYEAASALYNRELRVSFTALSAELLGTRKEIETDIRRVYRKYQDFVTKLIVAGVKEGLFTNKVVPEMIAFTIIACFDGILLRWSANREKINGKACAAAFETILLPGLLKNKR